MNFYSKYKLEEEDFKISGQKKQIVVIACLSRESVKKFPNTCLPLKGGRI